MKYAISIGFVLVIRVIDICTSNFSNSMEFDEVHPEINAAQHLFLDELHSTSPSVKIFTKRCSTYFFNFFLLR
jgi:hypothetical protein